MSKVQGRNEVRKIQYEDEKSRLRSSSYSVKIYVHSFGDICRYILSQFTIQSILQKCTVKNRNIRAL